MARHAATFISEPWPSPGTVVELLKPITWFPPMWALACGVVSAGLPLRGHWLAIIGGVLLAGPLICGCSQAVNDWFDREVDAINEPQRPIPSGRMPGQWGLYIALLWSVLSLLVAYTLGPWVFGAAAFGLVLAWAYSAPPPRLKQNGWFGNAACGACYEGLPWITGAAILSGGAEPAGGVLLAAALYSIGAHGIMTLNDFKAIEGDVAMGVRSLPVQLGVHHSARVACGIMLLPQLVMIAALLAWNCPSHATAVGALVLGQALLMVRFLAQPRERAAWYSAWGVTLYVSGMMITAFALRGLAQA